MKRMSNILVILWTICLVLDIVSIMQGDTVPTWGNMILAHLCLIIGNLELSIRK